jgi:hypothetical protein
MKTFHGIVRNRRYGEYQMTWLAREDVWIVLLNDEINRRPFRECLRTALPMGHYGKTWNRENTKVHKGKAQRLHPAAVYGRLKMC